MSDYSITTRISWHQTQQELSETFDKWGVSQWETNYPRGARLTGFTQSDLDRTVRLTYVKNGKTVNLEMGKQARAVDNLRVLYLTIESMRMNEKRGIAETMQSAYMQLDAPKPELNPYEILGLREDADLETAEAVYRSKARNAHPDNGGSLEEMAKLNKAIDAIRKERK